MGEKVVTRLLPLCLNPFSCLVPYVSFWGLRPWEHSEAPSLLHLSASAWQKSPPQLWRAGSTSPRAAWRSPVAVTRSSSFLLPWAERGATSTALLRAGQSWCCHYARRVGGLHFITIHRSPEVNSQLVPLATLSSRSCDVMRMLPAGMPRPGDALLPRVRKKLVRQSDV